MEGIKKSGGEMGKKGLYVGRDVFTVQVNPGQLVHVNWGGGREEEEREKREEKKGEEDEQRDK